MKKESKREIYILPNSNKGLSTIIATLIIILLVLVAAGIVWVVIRNIISQGAEEIELGKFTFDLSIKSAYVDDSNVKVVVRRSPGAGDLIGVRFIFFDGTNSISIDRKTLLLELQEKSFSFNSTEVGDVGILQEVSIAPIYKLSSGKEKIGGITDTSTISSSPPGGGNGGNGGNGGTGEPECNDGSDNDGDGNIDLSDTGCTNSSDDDETNCGDGVCEGGEDVISCSSDCSGGVPSSCDGVWNQTDIDAGTECDGGAHCEDTCTCPIGFTADGAGGCDLNPEINIGTIFSVWNNIFFDSQDLPKDISISDYSNYYVNFSNSAELNCFRINFAAYLEENDISYLRLDDSMATPNINSGETYHVWEAENCGA